MLVLAALFLSGCSIRGAIEDLSKNKPPEIVGEQQGLVSGAVVNDTVSGYTVSASVGSFTDSVKQDVGGYTVYTSLQSSLTSEVLMPDEDEP